MNDDECYICMTEKKIDTYYKCNHKMCLQCANKISICPYCKKNKIINMQLNGLELIESMNSKNTVIKNILEEIIITTINNNNFNYRGYKNNTSTSLFVFTFDNTLDIINIQKSDNFKFIIENKGYISYAHIQQYIIFGIKN